MKARICIPIMLAVSAACFFPSPCGVFAAENAPHIPRPLFPAALPEGMAVDAKLIGALHFRLPPPIDTLDYEPGGIGAAVLLQDTTAPDFFSKVRAGQLTAKDFDQP